MEILISLLFKLAPYLIGLVGILAVYFGVKHKGVVQERERQEAKREAEVAKVQSKVNTAVSKDEEIDRRVADEVEKLKSDASKPVAGDRFKF